jgi:acetate kinase
VARVLVVNAGSSSLKLSLLSDGDEVLSERSLNGLDGLREVLAEGLGDADLVAHRIVHGGSRFREAVLVDDEVEAELRELVELAPLHQPKSLRALDEVSRALPKIPAVACFDTAFHATLPPAAYTYALPARLREVSGVRRYGFHGLSHAWIARRVPSLLDADAQQLRIVSCHLGAGASLCAIAGGRSVDTTMGFTPLEGLVMATRSGSVDPGLVLWLLEQQQLEPRDLSNALEHDSGLLGLAGSADMCELLAREDDAARLAIDVYLHRLRGSIAAMAAALGGIDALVFTGGVGERSAEIRLGAVSGLGFLGVSLNECSNQNGDEDREIGERVLVIRAREDLEMARQARRVMSR